MGLRSLGYGFAGSKGDPGPQGAVGSTGPVGPQGLKGDTGLTGAQGSAGATGVTGASFNIGAPSVTALSAGEKNGTAFQPRAGGPSIVNVTGSMTGVLNVMTAVTVSTSPTQSGTYTNVATFTLFVGVAGPGVSDSGTGSFPVPSGHWVKVTQTGISVLANINMNRIIWAI